ncbi:MAG: hypothetical protein K1X53_06235 [Candidatus Sumerlaeaceae bacterium]|nr:hypothetical protein [Candidatus Sumerlaeaceae bacterium]
MEESIFEIMERTGLVDRVLVWLAIGIPVALGLAYRVVRHREAVRRHRHHWIQAFIAGPLLLLLWKVFNAVADHWGLDSVLGLFVNVAIFGVVTALMIALNYFLYVKFAEKPPPSGADME